MVKVSVLMPVYKTKEEYLREAIASILSQTFKDFEFLILDDCPEDNREAVVKSYKDKRIKYFKNEKNLGISASRNKLIDMAEGEYLAIFDHDDISTPERLEKEVKYLDTHADIGIVSGLIEHFPKIKISCYPEYNLDIKTGLMSGCIVAHTATMIRKSILKNSNICYEKEFSPAEDYMLFLRLVGKTMFYNIQDVLVRYRDFEGNTSHRQKEKMLDADARCKCFAAKEYPHLYQQETSFLNRKRVWIRLFGLPVLKVKRRSNLSKTYLFGLFPLFSLKG